MKFQTLALYATLLVASPLSLGADTPATRTTAKDVSRKAEDAGHAVGKYTIQQRDDALKAAKSALDDADARLRALDRKLEREWGQMDQAARKKARAAQDALRKERAEVADWYGKLERSSAESWDEVKSGFVKSYDKLAASFTRARGSP